MPRSQVLLVHPIEDCEFNWILDTCPRDLIEAGLFRQLAVELRPGRHEAVSAGLFAKALGAKAAPRKFREVDAPRRPGGRLLQSVMPVQAELSMNRSPRSRCRPPPPMAAAAAGSDGGDVSV